jgi:hypothetical protein
VSATINGTPINQTAQVTVNPSGGGGGGGTIGQTVLTSGAVAANGRTFTTASIAPAANALVTIAVLSRLSSGAVTPTVSGGGMASWTQVASVDYDPIATPASRLVVFRAMSASPGSGAITLSFANSMGNAQWVVSQWTGVSQTGTNGSGAIGQIGTANGNSVTALAKTLGAFGNANNVAYGLVGASLNGPAVTPGAGFAEITETSSGEKTLLESQWATNLTTVQGSLSSAANAGLLAIELVAGGGGGPSVSPTLSTVSATSPITAGGAGSTITVTARDGSGNPISGATVVLSVSGTNNTLTPIGLTDGSGVATSTLTSTKAEGKVVTATINGTAITQQASVTVAPAPAASLAFTTQPSPTQANAPITPAVTVETRDAYGNPVNAAASVGMAFGTNPGSGTLAGTLSQTAVNGVATFSDLAINNVANGYTLTASATGLTSATSNPFNITAPAPSASLSTVVAGTPSFAAGGSSSITVTVKDGLGNPLSGVTVALSSTVGGDGITQPATATDVNGVTAGSVSATSAGTRTITAVAGAVTINQKPVLTVSAGPADGGTSTVAATPSTITAGTGSAAITVTVRDQYGNPVSGANVVLSASPTTGNTLTGGGLTNASGVATGSLSSTEVETKTVSATAGGTAIAQTAQVIVTNQPPASITHTLLTSGNNAANGHTFTTASIAPAANALVTLAVLTHASPTAAPDPTVSGGGMTNWVVVASLPFGSGTPLSRLTIYRAMSATPGSGPITIYSSPALGNIQWVVSQWTGVDNSGTDGSGAIAQTGSATGNAVSGLSVALAAFSNSANAAYGVFGIASNTAIASPGSGFTTIAQQASGESTVDDLFAEWAVNKTPVNATWTSKDGGALAFEIKAGP